MSVYVCVCLSGIMIKTRERPYYFRPATVRAMWSVRYSFVTIIVFTFVYTCGVYYRKIIEQIAQINTTYRSRWNTAVITKTEQSN